LKLVGDGVNGFLNRTPNQLLIWLMKVVASPYALPDYEMVDQNLRRWLPGLIFNIPITSMKGFNKRLMMVGQTKVYTSLEELGFEFEDSETRIDGHLLLEKVED
jgi:hypothetical protein